jgi:dTDP-4-dehydrorhamnose reductase
LSTVPRLLITGISGFLGGKLAALSTTGFDFHGTYFQHQVELPGCITHRIDLTGPELKPMLQKLQPSVIIHTAACSSPALVTKNPAAARPLNVDVTRRLALWCREKKCQLLFTSSDQVYDGGHGDWCETDAALPVNPYGCQKLEAEEIVTQLLPRLGLVMRVPLLLGPPAAGGSSFSEWILDRLHRQQTVPLYTDQIRSAIGGGTLAAAIIRAVQRDIHGVFNVGGRQGVNRLEIGQTLAALKAMSYSNLHAVEYSAEEAVDGTAPLDISMNSERFWQAVGDNRGTLLDELTWEYR